MNRKRIGFDIDGVLADFTTNYLAELNMLDEKQITLDPLTEPTEWHWEEKKGFSKRAVMEFWDNHDETFWYGLSPAIGCEVIGNVQTLVNNNDVYFITHRPAFAKTQTERWLMDKLGIVNPTVLISGRDKGLLAEGLNLQYVVDDRPDNLISVCRRTGMGCKLLLIDAPYNRNFQHPQVGRYMTVGQAIKEIK